MRGPNENWYDTAQICLTGHVVNDATVEYPQHNQPFCSTCGEPTITACPSCQVDIKGEFHVPGVLALGSRYTVPLYCPACGRPFPWTESRLKAAAELADELSLSQAEKDALKANLPDLVRGTLRTQAAAMKVKKLAEKAGPAVLGMLRDLLVDIMSEAAKKVLFPQ